MRVLLQICIDRLAASISDRKRRKPKDIYITLSVHEYGKPLQRCLEWHMEEVCEEMEEMRGFENEDFDNDDPSTCLNIVFGLLLPSSSFVVTT